MKSLYDEFPTINELLLHALYKETGNDIEFTRRAIYELLGAELVAPQLIIEQHQNRDLIKYSSSLVCEMSADFSMSNGYPEQFRKRFKELTGHPEPLIVKEHHGRFIYYVVTRDRYFHETNSVRLKQSLELLKNHVVLHNVEEIAMHSMGDWNIVRGWIIELFKDTALRKINVFLK